ncbi:MAG: DUF2459 domain-containing protein [Rhodospirillales bacterium]
MIPSTSDHQNDGPDGRPERSRRHPLPVTLGLVIGLLLAACTSERSTASRPPTLTDTAGAIYVVSNGWHTNIVLRRSDLLPGRIPEAADFPAARFLEFGWGDADYYPAERTTVSMTLRAALVPSPAVVHLVGVAQLPNYRYPEAEIIALLPDEAGLARLVDFIGSSFERGDAVRATSVGPGLYPDSAFYPATGRFHLGNTCNTWTARALEYAGFAVTPDGTTSAADLMIQIRRLAPSAG